MTFSADEIIRQGNDRAEAARRRISLRESGQWPTIDPASTQLGSWGRAIQIERPAPPPAYPPPAIHQQQGSTTTTIEGRVTTTHHWGSAGVGQSGIPAMAPPTLFPTALQPQQQQPPQPQQDQWHSGWWKPASSWSGDSSSGREWSASDWHQPAPKAASKPAAKGTGKGKAAPPPEAPPPSGPSPAPSPPQEPDLLQAQLAEADAAAHADRNNWIHCMLLALRSLEDFSMLEIFYGAIPLKFGAFPPTPVGEQCGIATG